MKGTFQAVIVSLLEDGDYDFRMRMINLPWTKKCFLALIVPEGTHDNVYEFYHVQGSQIRIDYLMGHLGCRKDLRRHFNLAEPDSLEELQQYLKERCYDKIIIVEFDGTLDLDYCVADTKSDWMKICSLNSRQ